ncbi:hypothetical protein BY458DRAFT_107274 [Sporodiniella umbellata]|nr:hypothetical protein BY458DRAFT_107274 [Sporodiniella umbellata]
MQKKHNSTHPSKPLPIKVYPTTTLIQKITKNLLSLYHYYIKGPSYYGTFLEFGNFVWIDHDARHAIYSAGFFGKGDLSRSEPTWYQRTLAQDKTALEEVTIERRKKRREKKVGHLESNAAEASQLLEMVARDPETLQLDPYEAYFLTFALGVLTIRDMKGKSLSIEMCWQRFCENSSYFHYTYAVYHYYRSLGWVPKNGIKFGVDFVLYKSGPAHQHAKYAVHIIPLNEGQSEEPKNWTWLLGLNRVCSQVKKTLILCYVTIPSAIDDLHQYKISEVVYQRWSAQRNRE